MTDRGRVRIFDTTLRDGEQAPGFSMTPAEKVRIAEHLEQLGVDIIEAGFPISSDGDFEAVRAVAAAVRTPIVAGLARAVIGGHRPGLGGALGRAPAAHPRVPGDLRPASRTQAAHRPRHLPRPDPRGGQPRPLADA